MAHVKGTRTFNLLPAGRQSNFFLLPPFLPVKPHMSTMTTTNFNASAKKPKERKSERARERERERERETDVIES